MQALLIFFISFAQAEIAYVDFPQSRIPIDNICTTGETLRTIRPVQVCEEVSVVARFACTMGEQEYCRPLPSGKFPYRNEQLKEETACTRFGMQNFETPRDYQVNECSEWVNPKIFGQGNDECASWIVVSKKYSLIYQINGQTYALPGCQ